MHRLSPFILFGLFSTAVLDEKKFSFCPCTYSEKKSKPTHRKCDLFILVLYFLSLFLSVCRPCLTSVDFLLPPVCCRVIPVITFISCPRVLGHPTSSVILIPLASSPFSRLLVQEWSKYHAYWNSKYCQCLQSGFSEHSVFCVSSPKSSSWNILPFLPIIDGDVLSRRI